MPFINTKVSVKLNDEQKKTLKSKLGQAISVIPGKSEAWLMTAFEDECSMYFRGDDSEPMAFVDVKIYGGENAAAFSKMTGEITSILGEVLNISADRIYVAYQPVSSWGWNGSNF